MAKPKFNYKVTVDRVVTASYVVNAKNEKDALRIIKKNAKEGGNPSDVATVGETEKFGKLVKPAGFVVEKLEE